MESGKQEVKTKGKDSFFSRLISKHSQKKEEDLVIDEIVAHIEPGLKDIRGFRDTLREQVRKCHQHALSLVASLAGPVSLDPSAYHADPLVHASFAGRERLEEFLLENAIQLKDFSSVDGDLYGLMTMNREEKTVYGKKLEGNMIVGDAPMQAINFTEHRLVGVADSLEASKKRLERLTLEVIAESTRRQLGEKRSLIDALRDQQSRLRAMARMFGLDRFGESKKNYLNSEEKGKQEQVKRLLEETEKELFEARKGNDCAKDWLEIVASRLSFPEQILQCTNQQHCLNWQNVRVGQKDERSSCLTLTRLTLDKELSRDAVLVQFRLC